MDDSKWSKYALLGGPAFVVLNLVASFMPGAPPATDADATEVTEYFVDNADALKIATLLGGLAAIALAWWFGSLWRRMSAAEGGQPRLSVVALVGLALSGGLFLVANAVIGSTAQRIDALGDGSYVFFNLAFVLIASAGVGMVVFLAAVTSLSYRTKLFPAWINYVGWLAALGQLIGSFGMASDSGAFGVIGFAGIIVASVWILAVSWDLWKRPAA